ncbi:hypothetical protein OU995_09840 [Roseateles sp. SL47]|uniref:hypothetical protein n=1 Tax=Roseateles sp. SL47 TaxID=2995138 RepID=UPI00226D75B0|nr:hypothetical protein [Roseateles sp. SL47]WAC74966.1 hypothetical protein OU995_09840 [Roseateles sp. SL47]
MKKLLVCLGFAAALPQAAWADGWVGRFVPTGTYVSGLQNYHFRVFGIPASAGCTNEFAYVSGDDPALKAFTATLLMTVAMNKPVNLYVTKDSAGFCRIIELDTR